MLRPAKKSQKGFTIIELMLASAVFSVTLLIALNGFLQIGRLFYKGVSNTQTQNASRQILNEVTKSLQVSPAPSLQLEANGYNYYCLNGNRFTYTRAEGGAAIMLDISKDQNLASGEDGGNFGLLKDTLPGSNACAAPCEAGSCPSGAIPFNDPVELLGNKMRLGQLEIVSQPSTPNLYNVTVMVIYGDDESLEFSGGTDNPETAACKGNLSNQQFCSVSTLATSVYKGLQP